MCSKNVTQQAAIPGGSRASDKTKKTLSDQRTDAGKWGEAKRTVRRGVAVRRERRPAARRSRAGAGWTNSRALRARRGPRPPLGTRETTAPTRTCRSTFWYSCSYAEQKAGERVDCSSAFKHTSRGHYDALMRVRDPNGTVVAFTEGVLYCSHVKWQNGCVRSTFQTRVQ